MEKIDPSCGWLAEQWHPAQTARAKAAPYAKYKGDKHEAFWYFDQEMANLTEARYDDTRGKEPMFINFIQENQLIPYDENLHVRSLASFQPDQDGVTFHLKPVFVDSTRTSLAHRHQDASIVVKRVCGPVKVIDDSTMRVDFYRMGMNNPKRTWGIVLAAEAPSDCRYKEAVQQIEIKIPFRNTSGERQSILFPSIQDVEHGTKELPLTAVSDQELPVYYYVKEGPATIDGNTLRLTKIPPRSKFPIRVSVVAWQYGIRDSIQTAEPVERVFYITKKQ
ncbi:MAG: hypothetical protein HUJ98_01630 [Bacteroidaceae bacterium]|nr:hypothetical protein [Bacteroidaceae bacterium]